MAVRGDWATNEVLTSDDLNDTVNDKIAVSALGTATPSAVGTASGSAGTATSLSRSDHVHAATSIAASSIQSAAWTAWPVTFYYSGWDIGNASYVSRYMQIGSLVIWRLWAQFGTTSTYGSNYMSFEAPVNQFNETNKYPFGGGYALDSSGNVYALGGELTWDGSQSRLQFRYDGGASSAYVTATVPFTWTTGDQVSFTITYEAAV